MEVKSGVNIGSYHFIDGQKISLLGMLVNSSPVEDAMRSHKSVRERD